MNTLDLFFSDFSQKVKMTDFTIQIPISDWKKYTTSSKFMSSRKCGSRERKTLLAPFAYVLTELIQAIGKSI